MYDDTTSDKMTFIVVISTYLYHCMCALCLSSSILILFTLHLHVVLDMYYIGTGKTATFAIGILQRLDVELKECQALVLAPTRELAQQIVKVISSLGDFMNIRVHACVGGTAVREDQRILQEGVHVVVGTPGRVYDMISVCLCSN